MTPLDATAGASRPGLAAAIVAGGQARRFGGRDKSRLLIDGRSIIVRQLDVLQRITPSVFIVANDAARFADLSLPVHPDALPGTGSLGGLYTALLTAAAPRVLVVACDLPFLDSAVLSRLVDLSAVGDGAWVQTSRGPEPFLACYRTEAAPRIRAELDAGRLRAMDLARVLSMTPMDEQELQRFGSVDRLLANVNSAEDYARVQ